MLWGVELRLLGAPRAGIRALVELLVAIPVDGLSLSAVFHVPALAAGPRRPAVIAAHGLLSSKASDKYLRLAAALAPHGIALCRFDFRGCGESGGSLAASTLSDRLRDLRAVMAWVRRRPEC